MRSSHNTLIQMLQQSEISPNNLIAIINQSFGHPPKHKNIKEAIQYRVRVIQAERFLLMLTT
jgi:hypothetical protein